MNPQHTILDAVIGELTQTEMGKEPTLNLYVRGKYAAHRHSSMMNTQGIPLFEQEHKIEKGEHSFYVNGTKRISQTRNRCERGKGEPPHSGLSNLLSLLCMRK